MSDRWVRPVLAALTLLSGALLVLDNSHPIRTAVLVTFLLVCPGLAWSRLMGLRDGGDTLAVGLAVSIGSAAVVGEAMALARWWHPGVGFAVLAAMTLAGLAFTPSEETAADGDPA